MAHLFNRTKKIKLLQDPKVANNIILQLKGLIGCKNLDSHSGLWFPNCNWIHSFFMSMAIDVIYLDKNMKVCKLQKNLKPWRLNFPVLKSHSVIEVKSGFINKNLIELGDLLDVGH